MYIVIILVAIVVIVFFRNVIKFNERLMAIEDNHVVFITGDDVTRYQEYLLHQIINKYPDISDKDKVKVVIEAVRNAAKRNGNVYFLQAIKYGYGTLYQDVMGRLHELQRSYVSYK